MESIKSKQIVRRVNLEWWKEIIRLYGEQKMKQPRCSVCRKEIVESLVEVSSANDWLCLDCSGATLADFEDEDEYSENKVELMRQFHGKD